MLVLGLLPGAWLLPVLVLPVPWLGLALQILPGWRGAPRTRPARVQPLALLCAGTLLVIAINTLSYPFYRYDVLARFAPNARQLFEAAHIPASLTGYPLAVQLQYTFAFMALAGGAGHVTSIDSSGPALEKAKANVLLNGFEVSRTTFMDADVNASLRAFIEQGRQFDAIVLDPPKFAPTAAHAERAARAYKDINRLAFKLLVPGGKLFTYSCSGGISADLFHKIVASAGTDAGVDGYISERLQGAPDHPMTVYFPEGEYLKGLVVVRKL